MDPLTTALMMLIGMVLGYGLARAQVRVRLRSAEAIARQGADMVVARLNDDLRVESGLRAAADARVEQSRHMEQVLAARTEEVGRLQSGIASLEATLRAERERFDEQRTLIERMETQVRDTFGALSAKALHKNNEQFLALAKSVLEKEQQAASGELEKRQQAIVQLVKPLQDSLKGVEGQFEKIEKERLGSYERLLQQVQSLETKTTTLNTALRAPKARGRWGELQLRRVVELAGMVHHCDFTEQASSQGDEGGRLIPDLVVRMPGGKTIVVDAKAPMDSYLRALEAPDDDTRSAFMGEHVTRIRTHIKELSSKQYWKQFESTPELVVLFLPGEDLFSAALEHDPTLLEVGAAANVAIATPTSLITTLRAVHHGWREDALAENARRISELGRMLYDRIATVAEMWDKVGRSLDGAVKHYNKAVGSMEMRLLPTARELDALEVQRSKELKELAPVESFARAFAAPELAGVDGIEEVEVIEAPALLVASATVLHRE